MEGEGIGWSNEPKNSKVILKIKKLLFTKHIWHQSCDSTCNQQFAVVHIIIICHKRKVKTFCWPVYLPCGRWSNCCLDNSRWGKEKRKRVLLSSIALRLHVKSSQRLKYDKKDRSISKYSSFGTTIVSLSTPPKGLKWLFSWQFK